MREFWVASGHHLTRRADHGGLVATPELIMAYLARPELMPPADACDAERDLHASLMADPLRAGVGRGHRPACRCRRARKLVLHDEFPRPADGGAVAGGGLCRAGPQRGRRPAADLSVATVPPDPAQRARRLRRPLCIARGGAVLSQPTGGRSRRHAAAGRCGGDRGGAACPARPAFIAAHGHAATAEVLWRDGRDGRRKRLDLLVAIGRARDGR